MRKEEILQQLAKIQAVKGVVTRKIWRLARLARDLTGEKLSAAAIERHTELLADRIIAENPGANPVLVSLMDGAMPFAVNLQKILFRKKYAFTPATMQASSYSNELTAGALHIASMPKVPLAGRPVLVLDDCCETAGSYQGTRKALEEKGATAVSLVVLVDKVQPRANNYEPEYAAFKVPKDAFLVGMGMDYRRELRNEPEIRAVKKSSLPNKKIKALLDSEGSLNDQLCKLIALEKTSKPGKSNVTLFGKSNRPEKSRKIAENTAAIGMGMAG